MLVNVHCRSKLCSSAPSLFVTNEIINSQIQVPAESKSADIHSYVSVKLLEGGGESCSNQWPHLLGDFRLTTMQSTGLVVGHAIRVQGIITSLHSVIMMQHSIVMPWCHVTMCECSTVHYCRSATFANEVRKAAPSFTISIPTFPVSDLTSLVMGGIQYLQCEALATVYVTWYN